MKSLSLIRQNGRSAALVILAFAAAFPLAAQQPAAAPAAAEPAPTTESVVTNLVDLLTDGPDTEPAMDSSTSSSAPEAGPGPASPGDSYRRPSGRDSRSQRSRSRSSRSNGYRDGSAGASFGGTNANPNSLEWAAFQPVVTGNIFDPTRRPRTTDYVSTVRTHERDYFTLVGTMSYQDGIFAFFDGRGSEYQRAMKRADIIAGYKVAAINDDSVKLSRDTNQVELRVGMQMRQDDDGSWYPSSAPAALSVSSLETGTASVPTATGAGTATTPSGPQGDILKKMMERREKE